MIPISRQCDLLGLTRSSYYYGSQRDDCHNLYLMNLIDEQFTRTPFYGVERMTAWLRRQGEEVNRKRVRRLMRLMGLEAIYPKPRLSLSNQAHKKYPYLLANLTVAHPDQVWCADTVEIKRIIKRQVDTENLFKQARKDGMTTLMQDGVMKVFRGLTDINEIRRVCS
jgi:putative transposase